MAEFTKSILTPACAAMVHEYFYYLFRNDMRASVHRETGRIIEREHFQKLNCDGEIYEVYMYIDGASVLDMSRQHAIFIPNFSDEEDYDMLYVSGKDNKIGGAFSYSNKDRALCLLKFLTGRYLAEIYNSETLLETVRA